MSTARARTCAGAGAARSRRGGGRPRRPHTLRRSYISLVLAACYDLPYVQAQVGHKDPTTTLDVYARVGRHPDRRRVRAELASMLSGGSDQAPTDIVSRLFCAAGAISANTGGLRARIRLGSKV